MADSPDEVKSLFGRALELPDAAARAAFLDAACGGNDALRTEVMALLEALDADGGFLERGDGAAAAATGDDAPPASLLSTVDYLGPQVGRVLGGKYKLLEPIGEGGMGTVWMAEQREPVKRTVAVKLIKPGLDSRGTVARFEAERQALALMDHPNIARIYDAGAADDGRPFFVLELVKGVPITAYCDAHKLTPRERLALFVPVCQAVQHAHQKGVIHRDLKPGNVLVAEYDGRPVPKVIDFGVAKAVGVSLTDSTLHTGFGAVVGTPEYMSPEQASFNQLDVDTRTDVYALGVVLYELLAGAPPFRRKELQLAGLAEMLRVIREVEPPKPSAKISTADALPSIAANRRTEPRALTGLVRGELDWIVMKALEKDRRRRYDTAAGFARDVERYLAGEAVEAAPPSRAYRVRTFARRNRTALAVATAFGLLLVAATAVSLALALRAERARADATRSAANAQQLARSLRRVFETTDPEGGTGGPFTVRKMLDGYAATLEKDAAGQPEVEADLRVTIGQAYVNADAAVVARTHLRRAVELRREFPGPHRQGLAEALTGLAWATLWVDWNETIDTNELVRRAEQAESYAGEAVDILRAAPDAPKQSLVEGLLALSEATWISEVHRARRPLRARGYAREALALALPPSGEPPTLLTAQAAVAVGSRFDDGLADRAEVRAAAEQAVRICEQFDQQGHPVLARAYRDLAGHQDDAAEAEKYSRKALAVLRKVHHDEPHINCLDLVNVVVFNLDIQFKDAEADEFCRTLPAAWQKAEYNGMTVGRRLLARGFARFVRGDFADAERFYERASEYYKTHNVLLHDESAREANLHLGVVRDWLGRRDEARQVLAPLMADARSAAGRADLGGIALLQHAVVLMDGCERDKPGGQQDLKAAERLAQRWLDVIGGEQVPGRGLGLGQLVRVFARQYAGRPEDYEYAAGQWSKVMDLLAPPLRGADNLQTVRAAYWGWVDALVRLRRWEAAEKVLREAVARKEVPANDVEQAARQTTLGDFLLTRGHPRAAAAEYQEACRLLEAHPQAGSESLKLRWRVAARRRAVATVAAVCPAAAAAVGVVWGTHSSVSNY